MVSTHRSNMYRRYILGVRNVKHEFSMPPYGNDGGKTNMSYTPNRYGGRIFSAVARNL